MRVVIYDLLLANCIFHSTPRPTMAGMLISGWHKAQGDEVLLADSTPNFSLYDKVYIIKDGPDLAHDSRWFMYQNVVIVGDYWNLDTYWNDEWNDAMPDEYLYRNWAKRWQEKYPTVSDARMESFYRRPVKMKGNNSINIPSGNDVIIIDNDLHIWDKDGTYLKEAPIRNALLLYPIVLDGRWEEAFEVIKQKHIQRKHLWFTFDGNNITDEELDHAIKLWNKERLGRLIRIRMMLEGFSHNEWAEVLKRGYHILERFRLEAGKRIWAETNYIDNFKYPRILTELKRWTARNQGYNNNSLFSYMVYDGCRDLYRMAHFLDDPYDYVKQKKQGTNKLKEVIKFIEDCPKLMDIITTDYEKRAY